VRISSSLVSAANNEPADWRNQEDGRGILLFSTAAGLEAIDRIA
jgi:hypothetical protein